jgi:very-short-patch-repair endonuclease
MGRTMITAPTQTVKRARKLRSEMTLPEAILWRELRKRPGGLKFRRQHPAGVYVLDFYCAAARLAIEVDGIVHDMGTMPQKDEARSHFLRSQGVATLRVPAKVVLRDMPLAVARIVSVCEERVGKLRASATVPLHHPADGPPPPVGEE